MQLDTVITGGKVVTGSDIFSCDVGISGERIVCLGEALRGRRVIDARGLLVLPGGVDSHCHIEQLEPDGSIHSDADIVLWDPMAEGVIRNAALGHAIDYTPYEGRRIIGKPVMAFSRGELVMEHGESCATPGRGRFLARGPYNLIRPTGRQPNDFPG